MAEQRSGQMASVAAKPSVVIAVHEYGGPMNRHRALAALLILLALVACARPAAAPGQDPYNPYPRDDNDNSHGGGGEMM
jgi:hypothetical protein